jgi:uncharacterized YigZ family protein
MSLFSDTYHQIERNAEFSLKEKGSKFLAYSFLVTQEQDIKAHLMALKSQFPDATHHCYAYVIGQDSQSQRANDDGEPSNSAGRPILKAIISAELTNVLVVVVRYFGGTLLGIPGLIQAYGESATGVLMLSGKVQKMQEETQKQPALTEEDLLKLFSSAEKAERTPRGAKPEAGKKKKKGKK